MQGSTPSEYRHRENPNEAFDSICMTCFLTVATEELESNLTLFELNHRCPPRTADGIVRVFNIDEARPRKLT
jgi:hypothetical protein